LFINYFVYVYNIVETDECILPGGGVVTTPNTATLTTTTLPSGFVGGATAGTVGVGYIGTGGIVQIQGAQLAGSADNSSSSSPENSDDFVLVPNNLPTDTISVNYERNK